MMLYNFNVLPLGSAGLPSLVAKQKKLYFLMNESYAFLLENRFLVIWFHMPLHLSCYNFVVIAKVRLFREQTSRSLLLPTEHPKHKDCWIIPWS